MEPIGIEVARLRGRCGDPAASTDPELFSLRRRYLRLLESEPVPSEALRHDIRRDLARSANDGMRAMIVALLLAAGVVIASTHWLSVVAPAIAGEAMFALHAGLLLTIPAIAANEASQWQLSLRTSSRRDLNALLPTL